MATLDQTLQVFRALLHAGQDAAIGEADGAIWAYLTSVQGLRAQEEALALLRRETVALDGDAAFKAGLLDDLDRHGQRLSQRSV